MRASSLDFGGPSLLWVVYAHAKCCRESVKEITRQKGERLTRLHNDSAGESGTASTRPKSADNDASVLLGPLKKCTTERPRYIAVDCRHPRDCSAKSFDCFDSKIRITFLPLFPLDDPHPLDDGGDPHQTLSPRSQAPEPHHTTERL